MSYLLIPILLAASWFPEERTGVCTHPVMDFDPLIAEDTALYYDVYSYDLSLDIDIPAETLWARAGITLRMLADADSVALHFVGMEIAGITEEGSPRSFDRPDSFLVVHLGRTSSAGEDVSLEIDYHGEPTLASGGFGKGLYINSEEGAVTYTCNAPWGAKYWFPCQDKPQDKAALRIQVTVPQGYEVICNGGLEAAERSGENWTFQWEESHPIATYLIALAASADYAMTLDTAMAGGTPVSIYHWVHEADSAEITPKLMVVSEVMEHFSELFYPYPFSDEKYAHVATPIPGAMENQTCTHINTGINWGDWDFIVAHELSHSWWGNSTTCRRLKHMWLNEGFATYCEALWAEHRDGGQAYQDYYREYIAAEYLSDGQSWRDPVLDPPWSRIYSPLTYEKPASVLHMLRRITGDEDFFTILATYGLRFKDSTALSQDFEEVVAEVTGQDYSWFFDQWLRKPGHPHYLYSWSTQPQGDSVEVGIYLSQIQTWPEDVPVFRMPVEFGLLNGADTSFVEFTDSLEYQEYSFLAESEPEEVLFDPHGDLLCKVSYGAVAEGRIRREIFTCPSVTSGVLSYSSQAEEPLSICIFDVSGRKVQSWKSLPPQGHIDLEGLSSGVYFVAAPESGESWMHRVVLIR